MKSRKLISISAGAMFVALAASCSQEPLLPSNAMMEEYTKSFVKEFGIPAPGHTYTTAVQAGLKVTTKKGGHVLVTAMVDGKEYRFANLDVPAGTHALPVTIPSCVERLKISNGFAEQEVGINDIVDLDALGNTPTSRVLNLSLNDAGVMQFSEVGESPVLAFNVDELLKQYFDAHPINYGTNTDESTNYYYLGKDVGDGAFDPKLTPPDALSLWYGETALGSTFTYADGRRENTEYYIFPVWWRENRYGKKDYELYIHQYSDPDTRHRLSFNETEDAQIPFPELKYSTQKIDLTGKTLADLDMTAFTSAASTFDDAFNSQAAKTVVTKGAKVHFELPGEGYYGAGFCLKSSDDNGGSTMSYSQPRWNTFEWEGNYFDQSISNLMFSTVSTMRHPLTSSFESTGLVDFEINDMIGGTDGTRLPFLLGFTSGPKKSVGGAITPDTYKRDYTDFIMLVVPITRIQMIYLHAEVPEPFIWTLAAEDLGATDDWDFNDVVLHFTDEIVSLNTSNLNKRITYVEGPLSAKVVRLHTVEPVATGGTMPVYMTYTGRVKDMSYLPESGDAMFSTVNASLADPSKYEEGTFILGTEIHKWLGNPDYTKFINVWETRQTTYAQKISFIVDPSVDTFHGGGYNDGNGNAGYFSSTGNTPLLGFALLVDRGNQLQDIDARDDKGYVKLPATFTPDEDTYLIGRPSETGTAAPQMFIISGDWEWPTERTKISDAYPDFNTWITNPENAPDWYRPYNAEKDYVTQKSE